MKKLLTIFALLAFASPVFAGPKYASVNLDKVLTSYKKTATINKTFQKREADIRVFIVDAQKNVVGATTDAERKKLEDKYAAELKTKMETLNKDKINALKGIEADIKKVIDAEGKAGGYELIITSNNALYGAVDITDTIIKKLNSAN